MQDNDSANSQELLIELTADIVAAYVAKHVVQLTDLAALIANVHGALSKADAPQPVETHIDKPKPAVSVRKSMQHDHLTCLECGESFSSLKRHLMTHHQLSPEEYRDKWELPADYPMVAPAYAEKRSRLAKDMGLGKNRQHGS